MHPHLFVILTSQKVAILAVNKQTKIAKYIICRHLRIIDISYNID